MIVGVALTFLAGCNGGDWNPFDLKKAEFLPFFVGAYLIAFGIAYFVRRSFRGPDLYAEDAMPELDPYEVAYMTGGRPRVLATALVRLKGMHVADVAADGHVIIRTRLPKDADPIEEAVFKPLSQQSGNKLDIKPLVKDLQTIEAKRFARAAIAALERQDVDHVAVNAAGCGSSMKEWGRLLRDDPAWAARAATMAAKVKDVHELLAALGPVATRNPLTIKAAYHDACHLAHAQKIRAQPRALLNGIPGLQLIEIPEGDQCCGSAGVYNLLQPESAREIGQRKVDNVLSVAPELLVSANPGCTLQISMLLREQGLWVKTAHPMQVLDASIRGVPL